MGLLASGVIVGGGMTALFAGRVSRIRGEMIDTSAPQEFETLEQEYTRAQRRGQLSLYVGLGAALGGAGLIVWDMTRANTAESPTPSDDESAPTTRVRVGVGRSTLCIQGTF